MRPASLPGTHCCSSCGPQAMEQHEDAEPRQNTEVLADAEVLREAEAQTKAEAHRDAGLQEQAGVQKAAETRRDREVTTERKGSNEPILPVEELPATALGSEALSEAAKQLSAGTGVSAGDGMGSLQALSRGMRQTSAQDLEKQHQNMAAAQEQVAAVLLTASSVCVMILLASAWQSGMAGPLPGKHSCAHEVST